MVRLGREKDVDRTLLDRGPALLGVDHAYVRISAPLKKAGVVGSVAAVIVAVIVGATAESGSAVVDETGSNVYAGMSDDEVLAYDQQAAAAQEEEVKAYLLAHRSELEDSLPTLPVRELLAHMRAFGPTLAETVETADAAIAGRVASVSIGDDGSITAHLEVTEVGKRGRTEVAQGQIIDVHQVAHLELDRGSPVVVAPEGIPLLAAGQKGVYFLTRFDSGLAASYAGAVLPVRNETVAAPVIPIRAQVDGRSSADLIATVRGLSDE
jgi:hypothetical protein